MKFRQTFLDDLAKMASLAGIYDNLAGLRHWQNCIPRSLKFP
jgi:hypothetical protein